VTAIAPWRKTEIRQKLEGAINFDCPELIQRLLINRGYFEASAWESLFAAKLSELSSPLLMIDVAPAVARLVQAFKAQEKICIYGDFDLDGTPGVALLVDAMKQMGYSFLIPTQASRLSEGYGFHVHRVEEAAKNGVTLILTVDVGITGNTACDRARDLGVDVVVTDHHQVQGDLPKAIAVVNPNRPDCTSGLGYLCGTGVAFYLMRALKRELVSQALISDEQVNLRRLLDLVCLATITDMVPMIKDNRILVKHGLAAISETRRPGLQALMAKLKLKGAMTAADIGIRLAPKLNALSRMDHLVRPLDILLAPTLEDAANLVEEAMNQNIQRVELQSQGESESDELLQGWNEKKFVFIVSRNFHRGVVGLIANRVAARTGLPTYIGAMDESGVITGSSRAAPGSEVSVLEGLEAGAEILNRFGGHPQAAGFELSGERQAEFIQCLHDHFEKGAERIQAPQFYDEDLNLGQINTSLAKWLDSLGPFGIDFPAPLFRFSNVICKKTFRIKGTHLKLSLSDVGSEEVVEAMYFSAPKDFDPRTGQRISFLAEIQRTSYGLQKKNQLLIREHQRGFR
jgi:single-stranded-DNA-specific exonuclease